MMISTVNLMVEYRSSKANEWVQFPYGARGYSILVLHQLAKLGKRVRFSLFACERMYNGSTPACRAGDPSSILGVHVTL